jgi:hypothetical protein
MAEEDAVFLWRRAGGADGADARGKLVENFRPMVEAEAGDFVGRGNLGLLRALCCYRPDSVIGFYEYCRRRIRETVRDETGAGAGIAGAAELARLWGEIIREFSSPAFGVLAMKMTKTAKTPRGEFRLGVG